MSQDNSKEEGELSDDDDIEPSQVVGNVSDRTVTRNIPPGPSLCHVQTKIETSAKIPNLMSLNVRPTKDLTPTVGLGFSSPHSQHCSPNQHSHQISTLSSHSSPLIVSKSPQSRSVVSQPCKPKPVVPSSLLEPDGNDSDVDYRDMLLEYSLIQSKIQQLNKQQDLMKKSRIPKKRHVKPVEVIEIDDSVSDAEKTSATSVKHHGDSSSVTGIVEDDLDELQLRRDALASAANKTNIIACPNRSSIMHRASRRRSPSRCNMRSVSRPRKWARHDMPFRSSDCTRLLRPRKLSVVKTPERSHHCLNSPTGWDHRPTRSSKRPAVDSDEENREKMKELMERVSNRLVCQEVKSLSEMRGPANMPNVASMLNVANIPLPQTRLGESKSLEDNYEQVEMDIDSNEAPEIGVEEKIPVIDNSTSGWSLGPSIPNMPAPSLGSSIPNLPPPPPLPRILTVPSCWELIPPSFFPLLPGMPTARCVVPPPLFIVPNVPNLPIFINHNAESASENLQMQCVSSTSQYPPADAYLKDDPTELSTTPADKSLQISGHAVETDTENVACPVKVEDMQSASLTKSPAVSLQPELETDSAVADKDNNKPDDDFNKPDDDDDNPDDVEILLLKAKLLRSIFPKRQQLSTVSSVNERCGNAKEVISKTNTNSIESCSVADQTPALKLAELNQKEVKSVPADARQHNVVLSTAAPLKTAPLPLKSCEPSLQLTSPSIVTSVPLSSSSASSLSTNQITALISVGQSQNTTTSVPAEIKLHYVTSSSSVPSVNKPLVVTESRKTTSEIKLRYVASPSLRPAAVHVTEVSGNMTKAQPPGTGIHFSASSSSLSSTKLAGTAANFSISRKTYFPEHPPVVIILPNEPSGSDDEMTSDGETAQVSQLSASSSAELCTNPTRRSTVDFIGDFLRKVRKEAEAPRAASDVNTLPAANLASSTVTTSQEGAPDSNQNTNTTVEPNTSLGKSTDAFNSLDKAVIDNLRKKAILISKEITLAKQQVEHDENILMLTRLEITRKRGKLRQAKIRAQKLQEQLLAAQKIILSNEKQTEALSLKMVSAQQVSSKHQQNLANLKREYVEVTKSLTNAKLQMAAAAVGIDSPVLGSSSGMASPSSQFAYRLAAKNALHTPNNRQLSVGEIALEKQHLEDLAKGYASMIELHKANKLKQVESPVNSIRHPSKRLTADNSGGLAEDSVGHQSVSAALLSNDTTIADSLKLLSGAKIQEISQLHKDTLSQQLQSYQKKILHKSVDTVFPFQFPTAYLPVNISSAFNMVNTRRQEVSGSSAFKPYHSSLLCLRSYRFSPYFRIKEGLSLSSLTYSNKLDFRTPLCRFDLAGKCLDEHCCRQHRSQYTMSHNELLIDLLSYRPSLAGISKSTPLKDYHQCFTKYVENLLRPIISSTKPPEQCLFVLNKVSKDADHISPHHVFIDPRPWHLSSGRVVTCPPDEDTSGDLVLLRMKLNDVDLQLYDKDGMITADDVRYWMLDAGNGTSGAESAVVESPNDVSRWVRLAYKKMNEMKQSASRSNEYLDHGLNVLAKGLEANPSSSLLWQHYLDVYSQRPDASTELLSLSAEAVRHAPSYQLFWNYLQLKPGYSAKMDVCRKLHQYLCSPLCQDDAARRSHHLVEVMLYQASLSVSCDQLEAGLQTLRTVVQSDTSPLWLILTPADKILLWLSYIHLTSFSQLPQHFFDPSNSNPGCVVNKEPFVISWEINPTASYEELCQLFSDAVTMCDKEDIPVAGDYLLWLNALLRSHVCLEQVLGGRGEAEQLCRDLLGKRPNLIDIWVHLIELTVKNRSDAVHAVVDEALKKNPHSVQLHLTAICSFIQLSDTESALSFAERCPIRLFAIDEGDMSADPNLLYCVLLKQSVPVTYRPPQCSASPAFIEAEQANLWLGYCLLLDLQGAHDQAKEAYLTAISCLTVTADVRRLWLSFLRRCCSSLHGQLRWLPSPQDEEGQRRLWLELVALVNQALNSLPVKRSVPFGDEVECTWLDYSTHNKVLDLLISCLPDDQLIQQAYDMYLRQMPANVMLTVKVCRFLLERDQHNLCRGYCVLSLHSCPRSLPLWDIYLLVSEHDVCETRAIYKQATDCLPYCIGLWKNYVMFEIANRSIEHLKVAVIKTQQLGICLDAFLTGIIK